MEKTQYIDLECEANAHTPLQIQSAYGHFPRSYSNKRIMEIIDREALDQIEPGQNLGVYPFSEFTPINTTR